MIPITTVTEAVEHDFLREPVARFEVSSKQCLIVGDYLNKYIDTIGY